MEEQKDVMVEAETTEDSSPETMEQEAIDSEVVKDAASDVQRNLRIALQKERERRKAAEAQLQQTRYEAPIEEDEAVRRFTNVEAITLINNKILTDPTFKDRADLVQAEMRATGKSIDDADNAVLARLFRDMIETQSPEKRESKSIKQLPTTAIPEEQQKVSPDTQKELDMFDAMAKSFGDM